LLEYYRQEVEKLTAPQTTLVRMKRPANDNTNFHYTSEGQGIMVGGDGIIELKESEAKHLIPLGWQKVA
jgi:hypothetical protein